VEFAEAGRAQWRDVTDLYAAAGYGAAIEETDIVIVAKHGGQIVGAVRLCAEEGVTVLRGMQVKKTFQRQGIGSGLLAACRPYLNRGEAYCLPYAHLVSFYASAGFEVVPGTDLPAFLGQRLSSYLAGSREVVAMRRVAKTR